MRRRFWSPSPSPSASLAQLSHAPTMAYCLAPAAYRCRPLTTRWAGSRSSASWSCCRWCALTGQAPLGHALRKAGKHLAAMPLCSAACWERSSARAAFGWVAGSWRLPALLATHLHRPLCRLPAQAMSDGLEGIAQVEQRPISMEEAKERSREIFLAGSSLPVMPVVQVSLGLGCGWGRGGVAARPSHDLGSRAAAGGAAEGCWGAAALCSCAFTQ